MQIIKPNSEEQTVLNPITVFLAGSIEMGTAEDWQSKVEKELSGLNVTIFNPRREDWDSTWVQKKDAEPFRSQVTWELAHLEYADIIFMFLHPDTKSPISLLELGLHAHANVIHDNVIVVCPEGFWRKGNVDIVSEMYNIKVYNTLEEGIYQLTEKIRHYLHLLYERN